MNKKTEYKDYSEEEATALLKAKATPEKKVNGYALKVETLTKHFAIFYDQDTCCYLFAARDGEIKYDNITAADISHYLQLEKEIRISAADILKIAQSQQVHEKINRLKGYFDSIAGTWNLERISHIEKIGQYVKVKEWGDRPNGHYQERFIRLLKKWLIISTAQILGKAKNDEMLIFQSEEQGIGKTCLAELLCFAYDYRHIGQPDHPNKMYYVKPERNDLDGNSPKFSYYMRDKMYILFDELHQIPEKYKLVFRSKISDHVVTIRHQPYPRTANFIATANTIKLTGKERRYLIIGLESINRDELFRNIDVNQIYAECLFHLETGFNPVWTDADFNEIHQGNKHYIEMEEGENLLLNYFEPLNFIPTEKELKFKQNFWTSTEILTHLEKLDKKLNLSTITVGKMASKHFQKSETPRYVKELGDAQRGYYIKLKQ